MSPCMFGKNTKTTSNTRKYNRNYTNKSFVLKGITNIYPTKCRGTKFTGKLFILLHLFLCYKYLLKNRDKEILVCIPTKTKKSRKTFHEMNEQNDRKTKCKIAVVVSPVVC